MAASVPVGMTQPKGRVVKDKSVAVSENQNTMAEVFSVITSLRTKTCARAAKTAPPKTSMAPKASRWPLASPDRMVRRGESTIRTPVSPSATMPNRKARTFSPKNIAAKTTTNRGAA